MRSHANMFVHTRFSIFMYSKGLQYTSWKLVQIDKIIGKGITHYFDNLAHTLLCVHTFLFLKYLCESGNSASSCICLWMRVCLYLYVCVCVCAPGFMRVGVFIYI